MSALFAWAPPLPFVNEFLSLVTFGVENLDDCCEDLLKLGMLAAAYMSVSCAAMALGARVDLDDAVTRWLGRASAVAAVCVAYPAADQLSDGFAWHAQGLQESLRAKLGLPASEPDPTDLVPAPYHNNRILAAISVTNALITLKVLKLLRAGDPHEHCGGYDRRRD